ncbi:cytochrome b561 [Variovorax boronicumulans]|uniref:cytochrome b n=1 Tax=Variovorax boronicumulans TaxID=436515 RepID=UPI00278B007C|nr:cytochrome b [Variovorax boronicumulans]MDQ0013613.1 cytochrome b561 [Variovorax boronicumulans]
MNWKNTPQRYSAVLVALHWLMLLLLVAVYALMELRDLTPRGSALRAGMKSLHFSLGLCVLALVTARLAARWTSGATPPIAPPMPPWQARLARFMSVALYVFMIAMPLLGWLALSADDKPVALFGLALPSLLAPDTGLAHRLEDAHEALGTIGYFLIGLHAAAGLFHHYVVKDNTLRRIGLRAERSVPHPARSRR